MKLLFALCLIMVITYAHCLPVAVDNTVETQGVKQFFRSLLKTGKCALRKTLDEEYKEDHPVSFRSILRNFETCLPREKELQALLQENGKEQVWGAVGNFVGKAVGGHLVGKAVDKGINYVRNRWGRDSGSEIAEKLRDPKLLEEIIALIAENIKEKLANGEVEEQSIIDSLTSWSSDNEAEEQSSELAGKFVDLIADIIKSKIGDGEVEQQSIIDSFTTWASDNEAEEQSSIMPLVGDLIRTLNRPVGIRKEEASEEQLRLPAPFYPESKAKEQSSFLSPVRVPLNFPTEQELEAAIESALPWKELAGAEGDEAKEQFFPALFGALATGFASTLGSQLASKVARG